MPGTTESELLGIILDSWDRNNRILVNLLRAVPNAGFGVRVNASSPTVAEMFTHIHYVRLVFLSEDVPDLAPPVPSREWVNENNPDLIAKELESSARAVRDAVHNCVSSGRSMELHYDHPLLYVQHMIWHEGYHHGQIKLALKVNGLGLEDEQIGRLTWGVWMDKTGSSR